MKILLLLMLFLVGCSTVSEPGVDFDRQSPKSETIQTVEPPSETSFEAPEETEAVIPEQLILPDGVDSNFTDPELSDLIGELKTLADGYRDISIYYTDVDNEHYLAINADEEHEGASTLKALYCHFLLKNNVDRERLIHFGEATRTSASGKLTEDAVGSDFSVDELIRLAVVYSDNMAYRLLFKTYGRYGFNDYIKSLGIDTPELPPGYEFSTVTAHDLSIGMLDIYNYSLENDYQFYIDLLTESVPGGLIDSGSEYIAAHKYGYHGGYDGYHDTAIVYAEKPYILTIMTHVFPYSENSGEVFRRVTEIIEKIHKKGLSQRM